MAFNCTFNKRNTKVSNHSFSSNKFENSNIKIEYLSNLKFEEDKLFFIADNILFLLDGVVTNSTELSEEYSCSNWKDTFYKMYLSDKKTFYNQFRGSFSGIIYDIEKHSLLVYVDHFRTKDVFYKLCGDIVYFSSQLSHLLYLDSTEQKLNIKAAYLLLTFGATLEENTLFCKIKKIRYGSCLECVFDSNNVLGINKYQYYQISIDYSKIKEYNEDHYIGMVDNLFRRAVSRQLSKDVEYNYNHMIALSAGRDSRMTAWVAKDLGYDQPTLNFTFAESGSLDQTTPQVIAKELNNQWIFKALDNGLCLLDFHQVNKEFCGEIALQTILHGYSFIKDFNLNKYGLIHTGQIGDVILNSFGSNKLSTSLLDVDYINSKILLDKVIAKNYISLEDYTSNEEFNHINRGIGVTLRSARLYYDQTETFSPFNDLDLFNYCLTIPYHIRSNERFYDNWMLKKYPKAAKFSHNGRKIGAKEFSFMNRKVVIHKIPSIIYNKIFNNAYKQGMNPMDYWYESNLYLRKTMDDFFSETIALINDEELRSDTRHLYKSGNCIDKMQVLTLLSTIKHYIK